MKLIYGLETVMPENDDAYFDTGIEDVLDQTEPPVYFGESGVRESLNPETGICLTYSRSIRKKFLILTFGSLVLVLLGVFYAVDYDWLPLGILLIAAVMMYFRLRIQRRIIIDAEQVVQHVGKREWVWKWEDIDHIQEKYTVPKYPGDMAMRRLTFIHQDGRDISIDSQMNDFSRAIQLTYQAANRLKIPRKTREISTFILKYW